MHGGIENQKDLIIISFSRTLDMMHNMIDLAIKFCLILVIASASESLDKKE